jgi:REP element-mobilizing transposase RayT
MTSEQRNRHSIRLRNYDYTSNGAYFITICAQTREDFFGTMLEDQMQLNDFGKIVLEEWERSAQIRTEMIFDEFIVMPDHVHAIVMIQKPETPRVTFTENQGPVGAHSHAPLRHAPLHRTGHESERTIQSEKRTLERKPRSLGSFVGGFKSAITTGINEQRCTPRVPVWQRNYYDHIIRKDHDLERVRSYIQTNPVRWFLKNPLRWSLKGLS